MEQLQEDVRSIKQDILNLKNLMISPQQKEILSAEDTMRLLDCSRNCFDSLRKDGIIKVYRLKRKLYCKYSEIIAAIEGGLIVEH